MEATYAHSRAIRPQRQLDPLPLLFLPAQLLFDSRPLRGFSLCLFMSDLGGLAFLNPGDDMGAVVTYAAVIQTPDGLTESWLSGSIPS